MKAAVLCAPPSIARSQLSVVRSLNPAPVQIVTTSRTRPTMWSQIVTTSQKYRRADSLPVAFTEQGVAMLSSPEIFRGRLRFARRLFSLSAFQRFS